MLGLPCCAQVFSSCSAQISNCGSFSCCRGQALGHMGPVLVAHRLICPMECWIFQDQESELVSPALAGKFLTPGAPGKPKFIFLVGTIYQAKQHSVPNEIRNCTLFPKKMKVIRSCPTLCNPMDCSPPGSSVHGDSPGKNTSVGCHFLLQGIFRMQGSNPGLPHCRQTLYPPSHQGSSIFPKYMLNSITFLVSIRTIILIFSL